MISDPTANVTLDGCECASRLYVGLMNDKQEWIDNGFRRLEYCEYVSTPILSIRARYYDLQIEWGQYYLAITKDEIFAGGGFSIGNQPDYDTPYFYTLNIDISCPAPDQDALSIKPIQIVECNDLFGGMLDDGGSVDYFYFNLTFVTNYLVFD